MRAKLLQLCPTLWPYGGYVARQAPLSMGILQARILEWVAIPSSSEARAEAPTLWPPDVKSRLIGKDRDAGKDWRQEEKGAAEEDRKSVV